MVLRDREVLSGSSCEAALEGVIELGELPLSDELLVIEARSSGGSPLYRGELRLSASLPSEAELAVPLFFID